MAGRTVLETIRVEKRARTLAFWLLGLLVVASIGVLEATKPAHAGTPFTVNSKDDENDLDFPSGVSDGSPDGTCDVNASTAGTRCTLRAAIQEANATTAADTIEFDIPDSGVQTISPMTRLPGIAEPVTINGYTQQPCSEGYPAPCSRPNTKAVGNDAVLLIELNGSNVPSSDGLGIYASNSVVKGLVINRFGGSGIATDYFSSATNNTIEGNFIGTDPGGTQDLGNGGGVTIITGSNNTVGGTSPAARNLISGNVDGVRIGGEGSNVVQGNYIGTDKNGTADLGNAGVGVTTHDHVAGDFASPNTIGGNVIAFNGRGVEVYDESYFSISTRILSNSIFSNRGLGINLIYFYDGVTPNDPGDPDTGPNSVQNYPTITSATTSRKTGRSIVRGTLNSTPNTTFTVQLFMNSAPDPSGFGEGQRLLRTLSVTTDAIGNASFSMRARKLRGSISATATNDAAGETSEFSVAKKVARKR